MRLFIALDLPATVRAELAGAQARLRAGRYPVRWADPAGMHLTLQYLGEADAGVVASLLAALAAIERAPFQLDLGRLGAFPNLRQPRVVWAGVGGDTAALAGLQRAVVAATAPLGFGAEERAYTPHLTLGRVRGEAGRDELRALGEAVAAAPRPSPLAWQAGPPILFQSTLTPGGAVYTPLGA